MKKNILIPFIVIAIYGCQRKEEPIVEKSLPYFDVKNYIDKEAARLQKIDRLILKKVEVNGSSETKLLKISNWKEELNIFSDSEINRASWNGLFKIEKTLDTFNYTSDNEKVPIKELKVVYKNNLVKGIVIVVKNTNMLYTSIDSLGYFADSIYVVKKLQNIKFLTNKSYLVTGKMSK